VPKRKDVRPEAGATPDVEPAAPAAADSGSTAPTEALVPGWLALAVLILLVTVAALGGYVIRGLVIGSNADTPSEVAVTRWQREVQADPTNVESMLNLGYAYQQEGRFEEALDSYATVLELDPGNTGALYNTGMIYLELDRGADAEVVLWDVLEQVPDHALAAKALGEYYIAGQQYKSALVALEPVIEVRPQFADLQYLAGYACEQLGLPEPAVDYYQGALTYNPDYTEARDGLKRLGAE
jgi:superkiller protein 3